MIFQKCLGLIITILLLAASIFSQKAEITISLNEQFFDALLDGIYLNAAPPEFPLARKDLDRKGAESQSNDLALRQNTGQKSPSNSNVLSSSFLPSQRSGGAGPSCTESIKLLRENNGIRTAVRFRDGKIYAPLAFSGSYAPPFIGCVDFSGYAETNIDLVFDQNGQRLIARANVLNVAMNGTGGVGGGVIARLVQSSIDKKINPIEIIRMDKISFLIPIQNSGNLRMKATGIRHEIMQGILQIHITYEFLKA